MDEMGVVPYQQATREDLEASSNREEGFCALQMPTEKKEQEWWIKDLLPKERLVLLAAQGGTGKTSFSFYLADFFTRQGLVTEDNDPIRVAYWSFEDEPQDFVNKMGKNDNVVFIKWRSKHAFGEREDDIEKLEKFLFTWNAHILFIDPVSALLDDDGNNNQAVRKMLNRLLETTSDIGVTIVGIHHCRKGGAKNIRELIIGATSWVDTARHALVMVKGEDGRVFLEVAKSNHGREKVAWEIYSEVDEYGYHTTGFSRTEDGAAQKALIGEKPVAPIIKALKNEFDIGQAFNLDDVESIGVNIGLKSPRASFYAWMKKNLNKVQEIKSKKDGKKAWIFV